jgi:plasmid stability protein
MTKKKSAAEPYIRKTLHLKADLHRALRFKAVSADCTVEQIADDILRAGLGLNHKNSIPTNKGQRKKAASKK